MKCLHCKREIEKWEDASLYLGYEVFVHPDLVDAGSSGEQCREDETDELDSVAEPCNCQDRYCTDCNPQHHAPDDCPDDECHEVIVEVMK